MPAENFAPAGGGAVDPAKLYLIKGSTLSELLKKTTFDNQDFDVTENTTGRIVKVRPSGEAGASCNIELLDVEVSVTEADGVYFVGVNKTYEPVVLAIRNGKLVSDPGEFTGSYTIPTYRVISRLTSNHPSLNDTGAVKEGPGLNAG